MKLAVKIFVIVVSFVLVVCLSWAAMDTAIHKTSDYEFCLACHSHKPIGTSYFKSLHGGNNSAGWRATCSSCHIDQTNSFTYLWVKGIHGLIDPPAEYLHSTQEREIDWHEHRKARESYVFDSGCLGCHKLLKERSESNQKAFIPHRSYFNNSDKSTGTNSSNKKSTGKSCVSCHTSVGHAALGNHLREQGWEDNQ